ncbi:hypothetical protein NL676_033849 [Syzygium grande]|nr:hypothetical protein NL676_033849 [Syzygium grande]
MIIAIKLGISSPRPPTKAFGHSRPPEKERRRSRRRVGKKAPGNDAEHVPRDALSTVKFWKKEGRDAKEGPNGKDGGIVTRTKSRKKLFFPFAGNLFKPQITTADSSRKPRISSSPPPPRPRRMDRTAAPLQILSAEPKTRAATAAAPAQRIDGETSLAGEVGLGAGASTWAVAASAVRRARARAAAATLASFTAAIATRSLELSRGRGGSRS